MFDIAFSELTVIFVVALVVIGPERLPKVARTMGHLWGRAQRYAGQVKADISRDLALEELQDLRKKVHMEADAFQKSVHQSTSDVDLQLQQLHRELEQSVADGQKTSPTQASVLTSLPPPGSP
jgi:sec-independent protein translocase protein TatB